MTDDLHCARTKLNFILNKYQKLPQFTEVELERPDQLGMDSESPFHMACYSGNIDEAQVILDCAVDLNLKGDIGGTPLHDAVLGGRVEIVKLLLSAGADRTLDFIINQYNTVITKPPSCVSHEAFLIPVCKGKRNRL